MLVCRKTVLLVAIAVAATLAVGPAHAQRLIGSPFADGGLAQTADAFFETDTGLGGGDVQASVFGFFGGGASLSAPVVPSGWGCAFMSFAPNRLPAPYGADYETGCGTLSVAIDPLLQHGTIDGTIPTGLFAAGSWPATKVATSMITIHLEFTSTRLNDGVGTSWGAGVDPHQGFSLAQAGASTGVLAAAYGTISSTAFGTVSGRPSVSAEMFESADAEAGSEP